MCVCGLQFCWDSSDSEGAINIRSIGWDMVNRDVRISLKSNKITTKIDRTVNDTESKIPMLLIAVDPSPGPESPWGGVAWRWDKT